MKILFLPGMKCRSWIWAGAKALFPGDEVEIVDYSRAVTSQAKSSKYISGWIEAAYFSGNQYEIIIGHSMGGILALHLANHYQNRFMKVILVETFLQPSTDFYHNLLNGNEHPSVKLQIEEMLKKESEYYTDALTQELRTADYTYLAFPLVEKLALVYGNRGCEDRKKKINALNLPGSLVDYIQMEFVNNACHFPMIENEEQFYSVIGRLIKI